MKSALLLCLLSSVLSFANPTPEVPCPIALVRNGTYEGRYSAEFKQDFFLGMPFAQQPVKDLRFRHPRSLSNGWKGKRDAKEYGPICVGYGQAQIYYPSSEGCLSINVIRPAGVLANAKLPVGTWIYGGGFYEGSSADQKYNLSFIVDHATQIGKPFIAVSFNYRLNAWGFINSKIVEGTGNTNLGYHDQRLALHWIQENIAGFGGDPAKVTIWGESAGSVSVGHHMVAYGGRNDHLFRAAIMQSGTMLSNSLDTTEMQASYDMLANATGCLDVVDSLQCLRTLPFETLNAALNGTGPAYGAFVPRLDGDYLHQFPSVQLKNNQVVKVPVLLGTTANEGTSFGPRNINTTDEYLQWLIDGGVLPSIAQELLIAYPDIPSQGVPSAFGDTRFPERGLQWSRTSAYFGDLLMHGPRRAVCELWSAYDVPAYCYRFDARTASIGWYRDADPFDMRDPSFSWLIGSGHFEDLAFVFRSINGTGYHNGLPFNFTGPGAEELYIKSVALANSMASAWVRFIVDLDPNSGPVGVSTFDGGQIEWPEYSVDGKELIIFDTNTTTRVVKDDYREAGIALINSFDILLSK